MMNRYVPPSGIERLRVKLARDHGKQAAAYLIGFQDALSHEGPSAHGTQSGFGMGPVYAYAYAFYR